MVNDSQDEAPRRRFRPGRRGLLILLAGLVAAVAAAVLVPRLLVEETPPREPRKLLVPEGWRAAQVYAAVDRTLGVPAGTTRKAAAGVGRTGGASRPGSAGPQLPPEARGNPEGFLFPATYPVEEGTTPASLLRYMVQTADERFRAQNLAAGARRNGVTPYQTVTIASIVQAEADTPQDMGKVARVIYNRFARSMPLQMDSTLNYALGRSTLDTSHADTRLDSPYNTYARQGLPPTPIDNPGEQAVRAAIDPPPGDWLYFVTVRPGDTRFTADYDEHRRNVQEFNERRRGDGG
ncbi:endolytic transglycosylase MltG [Streptomyces sp. HMX112]|uniref:endolytic transglycosylase MltG n=1 Tax=Streptomyces sp. HMX112 TaxID=3390850 RepID=UPI003A80241E